MSNRTQLLLLGNGINRSFSSEPIAWDNLLKKAQKKLGIKDIPDKLDLPFPLAIILRTNNQISDFFNDEDTKKELFGKADATELKDIINTILNMGFDDILTTNYSYELEAVCLNKDTVDKKDLARLAENKVPGKKVESKYLIHSFNHLKNSEYDNNIWHIHGEAKKPNSIIIGHDYYARLLARYIELINRRRKDYQNAWVSGENIGYSWIDRFIQSDIYILGLGLDFSEMDLWWLLEKRHYETGNRRCAIYYSPDKEDESYDVKSKLLEIYGVEKRSFGITIKVANPKCSDNEKKAIKLENDLLYKDFYTRALKDIKTEMSNNKNKPFKG